MIEHLVLGGTTMPTGSLSTVPGVKGPPVNTNVTGGPRRNLSLQTKISDQ
ncbi:hypothetical protein [Amycolatopsis echigonensis]|uniref:Uncharacterized protein n=1 Tax=Amycolatopsis echigonensis TaxID=2576905 RepID=A0A8E1VVI4_9PSEU|nr:hypothetical protein [Amycolatopsis echigonensis]MBB2499048.1 hypothetical protein [Amycolatopsis echigonensis]